MRVASDGGEPRTITTPREADGEVRHAWPALVPNERALLFTIDTMAVDGAPGTIGTLPLDSGSSEAKSWSTLMGGVGLARAAARDAIVFARGPELDAIAFDPVRMATAGTPRAVVAPIATAQGLAQYAVSSTGSIVWAVAPVPPSLSPFELGWWSPSGFQSAADEISTAAGSHPLARRHAGGGRHCRRVPRRRLAGRCRSWHRNTIDPHRHQRIADLVGGRADGLLRLA